MTIRVLIVDDEPLARERLRDLLASAPDVQVVGECGEGGAAIAAIARETPDLVFLDIQMPGVDGFEVVEALPEEERPAVVFVTAHDQHALRAFEVHAVDYLLKPFDRSRFAKALARARTRIARGPTAGAARRFDALRAELRGEKQRADRLAVSEAGRVVLVRFEEIDRIEAEGNYVRIHARDATYLHRATMVEMESILAPHKFFRIHRSHIVNADRILQLEPWFHGGHVVVLRDGTRLHAGRGFAETLRSLQRGET